jgi:competence protein ComGF
MRVLTNAGMTLVEVVCALGLGMMLMVMGYQIVYPFQYAYKQMKESTQIELELQDALIFMEDEIRQATHIRWEIDGVGKATLWLDGNRAFVVRYLDFLGQKKMIRYGGNPLVEIKAWTCEQVEGQLRMTLSQDTYSDKEVVEELWIPLIYKTFED